MGGDEKLLLGLADGGFERGLAGIDLATRAVDFSGTQPALFFDEQDLSVLDDEHQGGEDFSGPRCPIDG